MWLVSSDVSSVLRKHCHVTSVSLGNALMFKNDRICVLVTQPQGFPRDDMLMRFLLCTQTHVCLSTFCFSNLCFVYLTAGRFAWRGHFCHKAPCDCDALTVIHSRHFSCARRCFPVAVLFLCRSLWRAALPAGDGGRSVHSGGCHHLLDQALPASNG